MPVAFLSHPARMADRLHVRWYDWLLCAIALATGIYLGLNAGNILTRGWDIDAPMLPTVMAGILVLLALEGVRRCGGTLLLIICATFAVYPLFADSMPGVLWGMQYTIAEAARAHGMGVESIIGIPMRIVAELLIGFIVFGSALVISRRRHLLHEFRHGPDGRAPWRARPRYRSWPRDSSAAFRVASSPT